MKAFVASLVLFGIMLLLIIGNCIYVHRTTTTLEARLNDVEKSGDAQAAQALWESWCRARRWLRLSVPVDVLAEIDDRLTELCIITSKKDADELPLAVRLSMNAVKRLCDNEQIFCSSK